MTSEQLQNARAERWRQAGNPLLTAEETRSWMDDAGLCLFAPRRAHFAAPVPSLVEAVAGAVTDAPTRETVETATALMKRLAADGALVPLNLFGGAGAFGATAVAGGAGLVSFDAPDFVMAREVLPYVFSLVGGRNWRSGPGDKASPLMVEVWTLLRDKGAKTAGEIQGTLGREVTEAAVLRALAELWHGLRVIPFYDEEETRWEVTQARFAAEMAASQKVAQTTALSALVSLYLDGVVAAGREEIEEFLSPLTARSRVREVVNGMQATRQLEIASVAAHPLLHVTGSLPEFAAVEAETEEKTKPVEEEVRPRFDLSHPSRKSSAKDGAPREHGREERGEQRPFEKERFGKKPFERRERKPFERKSFERGSVERGERQPSERKPFERKPFERGERKAFERKPFERGERFAARGEGGEQRRPFERKPFEKKPFEKRERKPLERGERKPFERKPFERGERKPFGRKPFERGERKPFERGEKKPFERKRFEGERGGYAKKRFGARGEEGGEKRPFFRDRGDRERGERKPFERKPYERGEKRPFEKRERKPFEAGERKPYDRGDKKPFAKKPYAKAEKPGFKSGRPAFKKAGKPFGKSDQPFAKSKPGFKSAGKPGFKSASKPGFKKTAKPFGKPAFGKSKPGFGKGKPGAGRPAFGKGKPGGFKKAGGFKPPFRKKKEGSGDGE